MLHKSDMPRRGLFWTREQGFDASVKNCGENGGLGAADADVDPTNANVNPTDATSTQRTRTSTPRTRTSTPRTRTSTRRNVAKVHGGNVGRAQRYRGRRKWPEDRRWHLWTRRNVATGAREDQFAQKMRPTSLREILRWPFQHHGGRTVPRVGRRNLPSPRRNIARLGCNAAGERRDVAGGRRLRANDPRCQVRRVEPFPRCDARLRQSEQTQLRARPSSKWHQIQIFRGLETLRRPFATLRASIGATDGARARSAGLA